MRRTERIIVAATLALGACGGKLYVYPGAADGAGSCNVGGAKICGGACGDCSAPCTALVTTAGTTSPFGICFGALPDQGHTPCAVCDTGEGCVERANDEFVCVPLDVCASLLDLGAQDVCWYADKSVYDGQPIIAPASCDDPRVDHVADMCGGACGACEVQYGALDRCVGQGPTHPAGVCVKGFGNAKDPSHSLTCAVDEGGNVSVPCANGDRCAIDPSPPADAHAARVNGLCVDAVVCAALAKVLPGGLDCR